MTDTIDNEPEFVTTSLSREDRRRLKRIQDSVRPIAGDVKYPQAIRIALTAWESLEYIKQLKQEGKAE